MKENWIAACLVILFLLFCVEEYYRVDVENDLRKQMYELDNKVYNELKDNYEKYSSIESDDDWRLAILEIEIRRHEELVNQK